MKLSPPKNATWVLAVLFGLLGIVAYFVDIPLASDYAFWLIVIGWVLLVIGTLFKGI
ncbi:MAG: hypothetical protein GTO18_16175 [Anaerolineales bacterium]|nr:hypothetical protein [Anaerolineales bacterium]